MGVQGAVLAGSAIMGALQNRSSARRANQPRTSTSSHDNRSTSQLTPWGGQAGQDALGNILNMGNMGLAYGLGAMPFGPSARQTGVYDQMQAFLSGGPPGVHAAHVTAPKIGPIHGPGSEALDKALERLRTGAGLPSSNIQSLGMPIVELSPEEIASFTPIEDPELAKIYGGKYMGQNPWLDEVIDASARDANRAFQQGIYPQIQAGFSHAGRFGSGHQAAIEGQANQDLMQSNADVSSRIRYQDYGDERNRMQQALGMRNEQIIAARNQLTAMRNQDLQAAAQLRQQAIQARMQGMITEATLLERMAEQAAALAAEKQFMQAQLQMQAQVTNAGNEMQAQALGLQAHNMHLGGLGQLFGMANELQRQDQMGAMAPLGMMSDLASTILPMLAQFGTQEQHNWGTGTNTQPGANYSVGNATLMGGLGGLMQGLSMYNTLAGLGAFGNPAASGRV